MANTIKIRSENCTEELKYHKTQALSSMVGTYFIAIAVYIAAIAFAFLFGGRILDMKVVAIMFAIFCLLPAIIVSSLFGKKKKMYGHYISNAAVETLVVCEENIYGTTVNSDINLTYDQISSVRLFHIDSRKMPKILNTLEIIDTLGKKYEFDTFKNGSELKAVIDQQRHQ